jgi:hypothetical protein
MRVRRETGDYSIKFTATTNPVLPKNLLAEDLLGAVIEGDTGTMAIVTAVQPGDGVINLLAGDATCIYTPSTGVVAMQGEG